MNAWQTTSQYLTTISVEETSSDVLVQMEDESIYLNRKQVKDLKNWLVRWLNQHPEE